MFYASKFVLPPLISISGKSILLTIFSILFISVRRHIMVMVYDALNIYSNEVSKEESYRTNQTTI